MSENDVRDAPAGGAVGEGASARGARRRGERFVDGAADYVGARRDEAVRADLHGVGPLGGFAQGQAGRAEDGRLLLDAAGVGHHQPRFGHQLEKIEIAERLNEAHAGRPGEKRAQAGGVEALRRSRVHGKDDGQLRREVYDSLNDLGEHGRVIDVGGAVKCKQSVWGLFKIESATDGRTACARQMFEQRVGHGVADEVAAGGIDAFARQVGHACRLGDEEQVAELIGEHAVYFLGHGAVEASQARLDVGDGDAELGGDEGAGQGAGHVADDDEPVGAALEEDGLEALHDVGGLSGVAGALAAEVHVRLGQAEVSEEEGGHVGVVVLPGVDEETFDAAAVAEGVDEGGDLHEVGPRAADEGAVKRTVARVRVVGWHGAARYGNGNPRDINAAARKHRSMSQGRSEREEAREIRLGRVLSELHECRARGDRQAEAALLAANAELGEELREQFSLVSGLRADDNHIKGLIRQGMLQASEDPAFAARLGTYQIVRYVGRGGMGIVLEGFDPRLRRRVAIKTLRSDLAGDASAVARFVREARAAAALRHENVVSVFDVGEADGARLIVMEFVDGPTLLEVIRRDGPLASDKIRRLFGQLLSGLSAAHDAGLIHRDIKSANLLLTQKRVQGAEGSRDEAGEGTEAHGLQSVGLKIADFGLARILSSQTRLTIPEKSFGTPEYMSPEQARGEEADHRTDLYSAGVVLYEMLTGRAPFRADSSTAVVHQVLTTVARDPRSFRSDADPALSSLAIRLMAKNPEDRLPSADAAIAVLDSHQLIASREARRRRIRMGLLISGCAAILVTAAWGFIANKTAPIIDAAPHEGRFVKIQRAGGEWGNTFYRYPAEFQVSSATIADLDGRGAKRIFATLIHPHNGNILEAIDPSGRFLWGKYSTLTSAIAWPDCEPLKAWAGIQVLAAPLDDEPGDELVVVTSDSQEYPTRVSIMKPTTGDIIGTFWNLGDIGVNQKDDVHVRMLPDFFEDGSSAILVHGLNNKLDGFQDARAENQVHWTSWEIVPVVMILDPREIMRVRECSGPPATNLVDLPPAGVYAYAFANLSVTDKASPVAKILPRDRDQGAIYGIVYVRTSSDPGTPFFKLNLQLRDTNGMEARGATFNLDRNLNILNCVITPNPANPLSKEEWTMLWVPIVQEGRWLDGGAGKP